MLRYAWKSIWRDRLRFSLTAGGVAMATLLIMAVNGLFQGGGRQIRAYIDNSGADLLVAQAGVRNMHMATSVLAPSRLDAVRAVPGVERAEGITYFNLTLERENEAESVYAVGVSPDAIMGVPWSMKEGRPTPIQGEIVIPDRLWRTSTPAIGGRVTVGGLDLTVAGLALETKITAGSLVFMNRVDAADLRRSANLNYLLVKVAQGNTVADVARGIREQVPDVTVLTRQELSDNDYAIALAMGISILQIMGAVGFVIGLAVIALTVYIATVEQIRQYGVLKAIGAGPGHLFVAVIGQALSAAVVGFAGGLLGTALVASLVPRLSPGLALDLSPLYAAQVFGYAVVMGLFATILPYSRIQRVDPVDVFRA